MDIKAMLKKNKIKVTKARIIIYSILLNNNDSLNAEDIYRKSREEEDINLSTVYRTLELFEEKLLIDKVFLGDNKANYKIKKHQHSHKLECDVCHKEVEIPCPMNQIEEVLKEQVGFKLTEHDLKLKGICNKCSNSNKK